MKVVFSFLIFLMAMPAAATCNRMKDGSCYNDDYIGDEEESRPPGIAVGEPNPSGPPGFHKLHKKKKRRPSGFQPVQAGGQVSGFIEINNGIPTPPTPDSPGSR